MYYTFIPSDDEADTIRRTEQSRLGTITKAASAAGFRRLCRLLTSYARARGITSDDYVPYEEYWTSRFVALTICDVSNLDSGFEQEVVRPLVSAKRSPFCVSARIELYAPDGNEPDNRIVSTSMFASPRVRIFTRHPISMSIRASNEAYLDCLRKCPGTQWLVGGP